MTPDQRKPLDQTADEYANSIGFYKGDHSYQIVYDTVFAAWDLATKAERERIAMLMEDFASVIPREVVLKMFNPAPRVDGTEERES